MMAPDMRSAALLDSGRRLGNLSLESDVLLTA